MELLLARRLMRFASVIVVALVLTACGADSEDEEPTATTAPSGAQPTVAVDEESTPSADTSSPAATEVPNNIDMSTQGEASTPIGSPMVPREAEAGSPVAVDAESTPMTDVSRRSATPAAHDIADASPVAGATPGTDVVVGDGTNGATIAATAAATPGASPIASPSSATPSAVVGVTECDVPSVPEFKGETTTYSLTTDVNFRTGPGSDCDLALDEPLGEFQQVTVIGGPVVREDDGTEWVQIRVLGTEGWVSFEFLEPVD